MISRRAEVPDAAVADLRAVGFPLLDEVDGDKLVRITNHPHGREGIIEARHFMPMGYDLSDVQLAMRQSNRDFTDSEHFKGVVSSYLGPHAMRLSSSIFSELILRAGIDRSARTAVTAVRIVLDQEEAGHLEAAVWEDGEKYDDPQAMIEALSTDRYRILGEPIGRRDREVAPDYSGPMVVHAVTTAVQGLGGTLSLISEGLRVDVGFDSEAEEFRFETAKECAVTTGNLITVKFPNQSEVPQPA